MLDQCLGGIDVASAIFGNQRSKAGNAIRIWYCGKLSRSLSPSSIPWWEPRRRVPTAGVGVEAFTHCLRGRAPWIGARDAADLAVAAHMSLDRYPQGAVSYPPGVEFLSHAEVAGADHR